MTLGIIIIIIVAICATIPILNACSVDEQQNALRNGRNCEESERSKKRRRYRHQAKRNNHRNNHVSSMKTKPEKVQCDCSGWWEMNGPLGRRMAKGNNNNNNRKINNSNTNGNDGESVKISAINVPCVFCFSYVKLNYAWSQLLNESFPFSVSAVYP